MPMKLKGILAFTAAAGFAGAASAADIYQAPPPISSPIYTPAPVFSWTGAYIGLQGGYDWNRASTDMGGGNSANVDGFIGGLYGGYNWQTATNWVLGIDGSINWSGASGSAAVGPPPVANSAEVNWKGLIRGRLGYAWDRFMLYGTAGAAVAGVSASTTTPDGSGTATPWGWTVGAGAEVALTDNVVARLDYSYQDYGTFGVTGTGPGFSAAGGVPTSLTSHTVMGGIALKF